jgi:hypothetical protein
MKDFIDHLQEAAKKPKPIVLEAERLRMEAIKAYKDVLKTPDLTRDGKDRFKRRLKQLEGTDYTSDAYSDSGAGDFKIIIKHLKEIPAQIKVDLKKDMILRKENEKDKKILENPYTICDLLSDPSPKRFTDLILNGLPNLSDYPKWMKDLAEIKDAMEEWLEVQGGRKVEMVRKFQKMVSCKNRAPWAAWSGKAWRGVSRSTAIIKKYDFTGEVKKDGRNEWLVAKGTYKSRYGAQSWSDEWKTAEGFSYQNISGLDNPIGVVFEVDLKKNESLLSADVIKKISVYGKGKDREREVIRVGNAVTPVIIYVNVEHIEDMINNYGSQKSHGARARMYVYDKAVNLVGVRGADAFSKTKAFKTLVKDFT